MNISQLTKETRTSPGFQVSILILCASFILLKNPYLATHPRIWAEEGVIYLSYAFNHSFWDALWAPHLGYFSLTPNLATAIAAHCFDIYNAPWVTCSIALLVMLIPISLIVFGNFSFWNSPLKKVICCLLLIGLTESEVWLNTITSQFHLGIAAFIILLESPAEGNSKRILYMIILMIAGLTGPLACFILPVYLYKLYKVKNKYFLILMLTLFFGTCFQLYSIVQSSAQEAIHHSRFSGFNLERFARSYLSEFFGILRAMPPNGNARKYTAALIFCYVVYILIDSRKRNKDEVKYFYLSFIFSSVLTLLCAVNSLGAPRYGFMPVFILTMLIVGDITTNAEIIPKFRYYISLLIIVVVSVSSVFYYQDDRNKDYVGAAWATQINTWKKNHSYLIRVYPQKWKGRMRLELPE